MQDFGQYLQGKQTDMPIQGGGFGQYMAAKQTGDLGPAPGRVLGGAPPDARGAAQMRPDPRAAALGGAQAAMGPAQGRALGGAPMDPRGAAQMAGRGPGPMQAAVQQAQAQAQKPPIAQRFADFMAQREAGRNKLPPQAAAVTHQAYNGAADIAKQIAANPLHLGSGHPPAPRPPMQATPGINPAPLMQPPAQPAPAMVQAFKPRIPVQRL